MLKNNFKIDSEILAVAVENVRDSIIITTPNLEKPGPKILYVNPAFTRITGYKKEEVLGKTPRILQGRETSRDILDLMKKTLKKKDYFKNEVVNYKKNGEKYIIEWHISAIRDDNGKITNWVSVQRDITDRKKLEKKIRDLEVNDIKFTKNEKIVFKCIVENPNLTDVEIEKITGIKRSTVTSIKNKLENNNYYEIKYVPNLEFFDENLAININYGDLDEFSKILRKNFREIEKKFQTPQIFWHVSNYNNFVSIYLIRDLIDFQISNESDETDKYSKSLFIPFKKTKIDKYFDYNQITSSLLRIKNDLIRIKENNNLNKVKLTRNDKLVMIKLCEDPYKKLKQIADEISLTYQTVNNSKNKLIQNNILKKVVYPNFEKFKYKYFFIKFKIEDELKFDFRNVFLSFEYLDNVVLFIAEKDDVDKELEIFEYVENLYKSDLLKEYPTMFSISAKEIKYKNFDFSKKLKRIFSIN